MIRVSVFCVVAWVAGMGCTSTSEMVRYAPEPGGREDDQPSADEAVVLFLRHGFVGGAVVAHVFERFEDGRVGFLAVLTADTHFAHRVPPGRHVFAVTNEGIGMIEVEAEGGHIYPVVIAPRIGLVKARFALLPAGPGTERWKNVPEWLASGRRVVLNERGARWWAERQGDLARRINERWAEWQQQTDRTVMRAGEGATGIPSSTKK